MSWLLRQLADAPDSGVVEVKASRRGDAHAAPLSQARATPEVLYPEGNRERNQASTERPCANGFARPSATRAGVPVSPSRNVTGCAAEKSRWPVPFAKRRARRHVAAEHLVPGALAPTFTACRERIPKPASGRRLRRRDHAGALAAIPSERDTRLAERHRPKSADADCNATFGEHNRDWEFILPTRGAFGRLGRPWVDGPPFNSKT